MYSKPSSDQNLYPQSDLDDLLYAAPSIPSQDQVYSNNTPNIINTNNPPENYIQIPTINQPIPQKQYIQKPIGIASSLEFAELLEDLAESKKAKVSKYFQGGFMRIGEKQKYRVSVINKDETARNIFICRRDFLFFANDKYDYEVKMKYIGRDSTDAILETKDFDKRLIDIISSGECGYKPRMHVRNMDNNIILGRIDQPQICPCCCKDANYEIYPRYNQGNIPKYIVSTNGRQCSYCCCVLCCCARYKTPFQIYSTNSNLYSGNILKKDFKRNRFDFLIYDIDFPDDALPEEKLLIICAVIGIDNAAYRELGNHI
jgi:hypothetical protein